MKGIFLIAFALLIDALQAGMGILFTMLQFMTPVGGGVVGAVGSGYYCWSSSTGILSGLASAVKCSFAGAAAGAALSTGAIPIGAAVDVVLSITLGGALIAALVFTGYFSLGAVIGGSVFEFMPFMDIMPGWTAMAIRCVQQKHQADRATSKAAPAAQGGSPAPTPAFDGIRPANDNFDSVNDTFYDVPLAA